VTRQLRYAPIHDNELDLVMFVNGLPVATVELKNQLTNQTVEHAKKQYREDRSPRDLMLSGKRAVAHFAVDPALVFMTTRLRGASTRFLPFNKGTVDGGAGNPPSPAGAPRTCGRRSGNATTGWTCCTASSMSSPAPARGRPVR